MIPLPDHSQSLIQLERNEKRSWFWVDREGINKTSDLKLPKALVSLRTEQGWTILSWHLVFICLVFIYLVCLFVVVDNFDESTNHWNFQVPDVLKSAGDLTGPLSMLFNVWSKTAKFWHLCMQIFWWFCAHLDLTYHLDPSPPTILTGHEHAQDLSV